MSLVSNQIFASTDALATLSPEELELLSNVVRLVAEQIEPAADSHDESSEFPWRNVEALNRLGLNGMFLPVECEGADLSVAAYLMCLREISRGCASTGLTWATNFHATHPIVHFADPELQMRLLPRIANGGLAAIAITESTGGSDATAMRTVFRPRGDQIEIEGEKIFITNGDVADLILVFGKWESPTAGRDAIAALVVDASETEVIIRRRETKLGHRASSTVSLGFEKATVPAANLVAGAGQGYKMLVDSLGRSRVSLSAHALGIARAALDDILEIGNQHTVGQRLLLDFESNQAKLAELASELLLCETMLWAAAQPSQCDHPNFLVLAGLLKMRAADAAVATADFALQLCGGAGYCREHRAERLWRDARLAPVGEGARELLAQATGRAMARLGSGSANDTPSLRAAM